MLTHFHPTNDNPRLESLLPTDYAFDFTHFRLLLDTTLDSTRIKEVVEHITKDDPVDEASMLRAIEAALGDHPYFFVLGTKGGSRLVLGRDRSGIKTGYYAKTKNGYWVGTLAHQIAMQLPQPEFAPKAIWSLLYTGFVPAQESLYQGVEQVAPGLWLALDLEAPETKLNEQRLPVDDQEARCSYGEAQRSLESECRRAHLECASKNHNAILLSGGIDSAVMTACFTGLGQVSAYTARVSGTEQDETPFAEAQARYVQMPLAINDIDPKAPLSRALFEQVVLSMNNPYVGIWLFKQLPSGLDRTYFAGQDTRLHTPSINTLDRILFGMRWWKASPVQWAFRRSLRAMARLLPVQRIGRTSPKWLRGFKRLLQAGDVGAYFNRYFLHWEDSQSIKYGLPGEHFSPLLPQSDWQEHDSPRQTYNAIVRYNWTMQYCFDTLYMQDLGRIIGSYVAMPFYHPRLAEFSSRLPWKIVTRFKVGRRPYGLKFTLINKGLLRDAFRDKICPEVYHRDKATSNQLLELLKGSLGQVLREVLRGDLASEQSLLRSLALGPAVQDFLDAKPAAMNDVAYGVLIHYIASLCVLNAQLRSVRTTGQSI